MQWPAPVKQTVIFTGVFHYVLNYFDSRYDPMIYFHHIPTETALRKQWTIKIGRDEGLMFKETHVHSSLYIHLKLL